MFKSYCEIVLNVVFDAGGLVFQAAAGNHHQEGRVASHQVPRKRRPGIRPL